MPLVLVTTLVLFVVVLILQRSFTEAIINRDVAVYSERDMEHALLV